MVRGGRLDSAASLLAGCEEPRAMGLGYATGTRCGSNIGPALIASILRIHETVPQLREGTIRHVEELQLVVPGIAEDRMSDTVCSVIKDFFISYTASQSASLKIPTRPTRLGNIYDPSRHIWIPAPEVNLPYNPVDDTPILFTPLGFLRRLPWINYNDYYRSSYASHFLPPDRRRKRVAKEAVLEFNARNYVEVERYVNEKERDREGCKPDPLFCPLTPRTIRSKFRELRELPTGSGHGADRKYENLVFDLLSSLLMLFNAIRKNGSGETLLFEVMFLQTPHRHVIVKLKSVCGPGDHGEPVLTIMLPGED